MPECSEIKLPFRKWERLIPAQDLQDLGDNYALYPSKGLSSELDELEKVSELGLVSFLLSLCLSLLG